MAASIDLKNLAAALGGEVSAGQVVAPGPGHSPTDRSLAVKPDPAAPGGFIVASHAGNSFEECKDYVRAKLGLAPFERKGKSKPKRSLVASYIYQTDDGSPYLRVDRFEPKSFVQSRWTGEAWAPGAPKGPRLPYRLPQLLDAVEGTIYLVEGEKDADRLAALGILGTTSPMGAGKWSPDLNRWFAGRQVCILPDNDEPGEAHAEQVAAHLRGVAKSVKIVRLPDLPPKGDASDWLDSGGTIERLLNLTAAAALWSPPSESISEPEPPGDPEAWKLDLIRSGGRPKALLSNALLALREAPELRGLLAYNEFSGCIERAAAPPWAPDQHSRQEWTEIDDRLLAAHLQREGLHVPAEMAGSAVEVVAREHAHHPVRWVTCSGMVSSACQAG